MKITIHQKHGLGNQLFQYAAGLYYSQLYEATMEISVQRQRDAVSDGRPRPFALLQFNITAPVRERSRFDELITAQARRYSVPFSVLRMLLNISVVQEPKEEISTFREGLPIKGTPRNVHLVGYWQVHQMARFVEAQLRREFSFVKPATGENKRTLEKITQCATPVSVHVRRGDYKTFGQRNAVLPMSYYIHAIQYVKQRYPDSTLVFFSDEIEEVKQEFDGMGHSIFVGHNNAFSAHEDLRLMSACQHHIIANSSFSWWGAWLNPSVEKLVCAPDVWLDWPHPDLIPREWVRIPA